jgi:acyl-CoA synthetase (AMP-forming)/AMP-acid ligase II
MQAYWQRQTKAQAFIGYYEQCLKERMPRHQYPRQLEIVDDIPKSETGEILRGALRAQESAKLRGQRQPHPREL